MSNATDSAEAFMKQIAEGLTLGARERALVWRALAKATAPRVLICVDLDNTLTATPAFYQFALAALRAGGAQVHVLSGTHTDEVTPQEVAEKLALLSSLGFEKGREYDEAIAVPGPEKNVPANKVAYLRQVSATALIDDAKPNCKAARKAGFLALRHLSPKPPKEPKA